MRGRRHRRPVPGPQGPGTRLGCRHCGRLLVRCPLGAACPGTDPLNPAACRRCSWGALCPVHDRRWTRI